MIDQERLYFAKRAEEEERLAVESSDPTAAAIHRKLQQAYVERASLEAAPDAETGAVA